MFVCMAVNQELAVGASLQRSTTVCWPSGEWSSSSLHQIKIEIAAHGNDKISNSDVEKLNQLVRWAQQNQDTERYLSCCAVLLTWKKKDGKFYSLHGWFCMQTDEEQLTCSPGLAWWGSCWWSTSLDWWPFCLWRWRKRCAWASQSPHFHCSWATAGGRRPTAGQPPEKVSWRAEKLPGCTSLLRGAEQDT